MFSRRTSTVVAVVVIAAVLLTLAGALFPALAAPRPAALPAHAALTSTTPADGSTVATADEVVLSFTDEIGADFLQVVVEGPDGDETDGDPRAEGRDVVQPLVTDLPAGEHTVTYRVVSADGHPVSGSVTFTTTEEPSPSPSASSDAPSATPTATSPDPTPSEPSGPAVSPAAQPGSGTPGWVLPALLVLALGLVAGVALLLRDRRGRGDG